MLRYGVLLLGFNRPDSLDGIELLEDRIGHCLLVWLLRTNLLHWRQPSWSSTDIRKQTDEQCVRSWLPRWSVSWSNRIPTRFGNRISWAMLRGMNCLNYFSQWFPKGCFNSSGRTNLAGCLFACYRCFIADELGGARGLVQLVATAHPWALGVPDMLYGWGAGHGLNICPFIPSSPKKANTTN